MADEHNDTTEPAHFDPEQLPLTPEPEVVEAAADAAVAAEAIADVEAEVIAEVVAESADVVDAEAVAVAVAVPESIAAEPSQPAPAEPTPAEPEPAAPVTAVSLGLLPAEFVSQVSTQLMFYAPEIVALPASPGRGGDANRDDFGDQGPESGSSARRRNRRRGGGQASDADDAQGSPERGERPAVSRASAPSS